MPPKFSMDNLCETNRMRAAPWQLALWDLRGDSQWVARAAVQAAGLRIQPPTSRLNLVARLGPHLCQGCARSAGVRTRHDALPGRRSFQFSFFFNVPK